MEKWQAFIGTWKTEGETTTGDKITGFDSYEWFPGNFFVIHKVDVKMGEEHIQGMEIISYDATTGKYPMQYYNNKGDTSLSQATENNGKWNITGEKERLAFSITENGNVIAGTWEGSEDGKTWAPIMNIKLTKIP